MDKSCQQMSTVDSYNCSLPILTEANACSLTKKRWQPWWIVDLNREFLISSVDVDQGLSAGKY
jgi:hypothetical protein